MPQQTNKVTWFELPADDVARAGEFYKTVFGWETPDMGMGDGSLVAQTAPTGEDMQPLDKGTINGTIAPRSTAFDKPHIVITVDDLDSKIEEVKQAGGAVVQERQDIEGMMAFAIIRDTEDNNVGIIQNF